MATSKHGVELAGPVQRAAVYVAFWALGLALLTGVVLVVAGVVR